MTLFIEACRYRFAGGHRDSYLNPSENGFLMNKYGIYSHSRNVWDVSAVS
jgi:hypothetical protein